MKYGNNERSKLMEKKKNRKHTRKRKIEDRYIRHTEKALGMRRSISSRDTDIQKCNYNCHDSEEVIDWRGKLDECALCKN